MGDLGDDFREMREHRRKVKEKNSDKALRLIEATDFDYDILSHNGPHMRFALGFDFWPSTGTWINLTTREQGFGARSLIEQLKKADQ